MFFTAPIAKAVPVLMYHHVSPNPGLVTVSPATFEAHMQYLSEHGWNTITCDELAGFMTGQQMLPEKSVLITFDDGYLDNYIYAHPVLEKYQQKATLFIVTGWIGSGETRDIIGYQANGFCPDHKACKRAIADGRQDDVILRWSEIELMHCKGTFEFHSHTHTHTRWDKSEPDKRFRKMTEELQLSRQSLSDHLGITSHHLCWPQGYYEPEYMQIAGQAGFEYLYTTQKSLVTVSSDQQQIGRIVVKDSPASWLAKRLWLYSHSLVGGWYIKLRGQ